MWKLGTGTRSIDMSYLAPKTVSLDTVRSHSRFNRKLTELSIPPLTESAHAQFLASGNLERMARAIEVAHTEGGARHYVIRMLEPLCSIEASSAPQPQASTSCTAAPAGGSRVTNLAEHRRSSRASYDDETYPTQPPVDDNAPPPYGDEPNDPSPAPAAADTRGQREFHTVHVYGSRAALCFSADQTRGAVHTITIEAAPLISERKYNWSAKVSLQLTAAEMPHVASVLFGLLPQCEYSNHGPQHNKGFQMVNQRDEGKPGRVYVQLRAPGTSLQVPIFGSDLWRVGNLFARQLMTEHRNLKTTSDVFAMLRATFVRMLG